MLSKKILLVISCSKKKDELLKVRPMKAMDAYHGPMFQVINKAKRENRWNSNIELGIISAKYGFLRDKDLIEYYDKKMSRKLALLHRQQILTKIKEWHSEENFSLIYILMGKMYLESVENLENIIKTEIKIESMQGLGIGQQKLFNFIESMRKRVN